MSTRGQHRGLFTFVACGLGMLAFASTGSHASAEEPAPSPTLQGLLAAGLGAGQRSVHLPTAEGVRQVETGLFPALDVLVRADGRLGERGQLGLHLRYQTSLGITAVETRPGAVERSSPARTHHLDTGLVPALRFTSSRDSVALGLFVGWGFRAFSTVVPLTVPSYTLHGPMAKLELRVPISGDAVALHVRPEVHAWLWATDELRDLGAIDDGGVALGAELGLDVRLSEDFSLALGYRESHGGIGTAFGTFTDVERFGSLQLVLVY